VGNGFPGLAIVSLIALLVALGIAALIALQPWAANSTAPQLSVAPGLGIGLGDSVVVALAPEGDVADARIARAGKPTFIDKPAPTREPGPVRELAVARARPVAHPKPVAAPVRPPRPPSPRSPSQPQATPVSVPTPAPVSSPESSPAPSTQVVASNGNGLQGPIAGGAEVGSTTGVVQVREGDEYAFSFSFSAEPIAYRMPGDDNLIVRFIGEASERPSFGLQLWDDGTGSGHGLWSSGEAMGGEHFLVSVADSVNHEVTVYFRASSAEDGFYLLFLDGQPVDVRAGVSLIDAGSSYAQVEAGLFREGEHVERTPEIRFGPVRLGTTLGSVLP